MKGLGFLRRFDLLILVVLLLAFLFSFWTFFSYFLHQDVSTLGTLQWVVEKFSGRSGGMFSFFFNPSVTECYRPLSQVIFIGAWQFWGTDARYYYILTLIFFSLIAVYLYKIGKDLKSRAAGFISTVAFMSFFPIHLALSQKLNTHMISATFLLVSFFYLMAWFRRERRRDLFLGLLFAILSAVAGEEVVILAPLLIGFLLFCHRTYNLNLKKGLSLALGIGFVEGLLILVTCSRGALSKAPLDLRLWRVFINFKYFSWLIVTFFSLPIFILIIGSLRKKINYVIIYGTIVLLLLFLFSYRLAYIPVVIMFLLISASPLAEPQKRFAIFWGFLGLATIVILAYTYHRLIYPAVFGFALLTGLSLPDYFSELKTKFNRAVFRELKSCQRLFHLISLFTILALLGGGLFQIIRQDIRGAREDLTSLIRVGQNVRMAGDYLCQNLPIGAHVIEGPGGLLFGRSPRFYWFCRHTGRKDLKFCRFEDRGIRLPLGSWELIPEEFFSRPAYWVADADWVVRYMRDNPISPRELSDYLEEDFFLISSEAPVKIEVIENKGVKASKRQFMRNSGGPYPASIIYRLESSEEIERLDLITYPSIENSKANQIKGYYSLDSKRYRPFFTLRSNGSRSWGTLGYGNILWKRCFPKSRVVYLKFSFWRGCQLWSTPRQPSVLTVNREWHASLKEERSYDFLWYRGVLLPTGGTVFKDSFLVKGKLLKVISRNGYGFAIFKLERR